MLNNINLSIEQRKKLNKLWFIFGNNGKKHSHRNHRFIQNLLEHGEDTREFYSQSPHTEKIKEYNEELTLECIQEVDKILNNE